MQLIDSLPSWRPALVAATAAAVGVVLAGPAVAGAADPAHAAKRTAQPASVLHAGETLAPGGRLEARRGPSRLTMRRNGNLVLEYLPLRQRTSVARAARPVSRGCRTRRCRFLRPRPLWSSRTAGHPGARLRVEADRVVVADGTRVLWSARTSGHAISSLALLDSGNLVARAASGTRRQARAAVSVYRWQTGTSTPVSLGSTLASGQALQSNQFLVSPSGEYEFDMAPDGLAAVWVMGGAPCAMYVMPSLDSVGNALGSYNLYRYVWTQEPVPGSTMTMQSGGNLVLTAPDGSLQWQSGTNIAGTTLTLQNDGNLVAYGPGGTAVWETATDYQRGAEMCPGTTMENDQVLRSWDWTTSTDGYQELAFELDGDEGAELDVLGIESDGSVGGNAHVYRSKSAVGDPYVTMQTDGNLVAYPTGYSATAANAEWSSGTSGNPGAWATLRLSGEALQVLGAPQVEPGDSRSYLPETAILWESATPVHGLNNAALLGPTIVPLG